MTSTAAGQPPPDDPHRPGEQRAPQPGPGPDYRQCRTCRLSKPLQDFVARRKHGCVIRYTGCCEQERFSKPFPLTVGVHDHHAQVSGMHTGQGCYRHLSQRLLSGTYVRRGLSCQESEGHYV